MKFKSAPFRILVLATIAAVAFSCTQSKREFKLEELRGRLTRAQVGDNEVLLLDGEKFIDFFPPRITTDHRNGSHFLRVELPYRLFDWELAP